MGARGLGEGGGGYYLFRVSTLEWREWGGGGERYLHGLDREGDAEDGAGDEVEEAGGDEGGGEVDGVLEGQGEGEGEEGAEVAEGA